MYTVSSILKKANIVMSSIETVEVCSSYYVMITLHSTDYFTKPWSYTDAA